MMRRRDALPILVAGATVRPARAAVPAWRLQHFHDESRSSLTLVDVAFPSATRGVAVGIRQEERGQQGAALVTGDGGRTWTPVEVGGLPRSVRFLNEQLGWLVADNGLWRTEEAGRSWQRVARLPGALAVSFLDEQRGFAVGTRKRLWRTGDGGKTWDEVEAARQLIGNPDHSVLHLIERVSPQELLVLGHSRPPRRDSLAVPEWADPEAAKLRPQVPTTLLQLESRDGGQTWKSNAASVFGDLTRFRPGPDRTYLGVFRFRQQFPHASELVLADLKTGQSSTVSRPKEYVITDAVSVGKIAYVAGVQRTSTLNESPIPGAVRLFQSRNLSLWEPMEVDYRAVATRVSLAVREAGQAWAVTDTGMILGLHAG